VKLRGGLLISRRGKQIRARTKQENVFGRFHRYQCRGVTLSCGRKNGIGLIIALITPSHYPRASHYPRVQVGLRLIRTNIPELQFDQPPWLAEMALDDLSTSRRRLPSDGKGSVRESVSVYWPFFALSTVSPFEPGANAPNVIGLYAIELRRTCFR